MACPDSECHTKLATVCTLIHDEDKGLVSRVSKRSMANWTRAIIGFGITICLAVAVAWGAAGKQRNQNKQDVAVVKESITNGFERMFDKLDDLEKNQITLQDVHEAITKRINK